MGSKENKAAASLIRGNSGEGLDSARDIELEAAAVDDVSPHKLVRASEDQGDEVETSEDPGMFLMPELRALSLPRAIGKPGATRTKRVQGQDDRVQVANTRDYPWRAICLLVMKKGGKRAQGTGWFAGPNSVITAAHNLFDNDELGSGWIESVEVSPAINGVSRPWKTVTVGTSGIAVSSAWRAIPRRSDRGLFDFALIQLDEALGKQTGWFSLAPWDDSDLRGKQFNVVGYPGEGKPKNQSQAKFIPKFTLWGDVGVITDPRPNILLYEMDSTGGQSGCPVFARDEQSTDGTMFCVGIHTQGQAGKNQATRITDAVIQEIKDF